MLFAGSRAGLVASGVRLRQPLRDRFGWLLGASYAHNRTPADPHLGRPRGAGQPDDVTNVVDEITRFGERSWQLAPGLVASAGGMVGRAKAVRPGGQQAAPASPSRPGATRAGGLPACARHAASSCSSWAAWRAWRTRADRPPSRCAGRRGSASDPPFRPHRFPSTNLRGKQASPGAHPRHPMRPKGPAPGAPERSCSGVPAFSRRLSKGREPCAGLGCPRLARPAAGEDAHHPWLRASDPP